MSNEHLQEEDLQLYAEKGVGSPDKTAHLQICPQCRSQVTAYRLLFTLIREEEEPALAISPADLIPLYLPDLKADQQKERRLINGILVAAGVAFVMMVIAGWRTLYPFVGGLPPLTLAAGFLLPVTLLAMQWTELKARYPGKIDAIPPIGGAT